MKGYNTHILTPEGKVKLEEEMKSLRDVRPSALDDLQRARAQGDLKENSAYQAARERLTNLDRRIVKLELTLRNSTVVEKTDSDAVQLGSEVSLVSNGISITYHIVGENESDIKQKKISLKSPLAQALMGKRKGDKAMIVTPSGQIEYEVVTIK